MEIFVYNEIFQSKAESVGVEPTQGYLHLAGLANLCLTVRPTLQILLS